MTCSTCVPLFCCPHDAQMADVLERAKGLLQRESQPSQLAAWLRAQDAESSPAFSSAQLKRLADMLKLVVTVSGIQYCSVPLLYLLHPNMFICYSAGYPCFTRMHSLSSLQSNCNVCMFTCACLHKHNTRMHSHVISPTHAFISVCFPYLPFSCRL